MTGDSDVERVTCFRTSGALHVKTVSPMDTAVYSPKNRMLRNAYAEDLGKLCLARPQRFPCSPSFRAHLHTSSVSSQEILTPPPARPPQTLTKSATSNFNSTRATYYLLASDPSFPRLFPFLFQFDLGNFGDLSTG